MNIDALFKELEPPAGGTARFARRLGELAAPRPTRRAAMLGAAAIAAALVVATILLRPSGETPVLTVEATPSVDVFNAPEFDRLLGRAAPRAELVILVNAEAANITEIETTNDKIRIYEID